MPNEVFDSLLSWLEQWMQVVDGKFTTEDAYAKYDYHRKIKDIYNLYKVNVPEYDEPKTLTESEKEAFKNQMIAVEDKYKGLKMFGQSSKTTIKQALREGKKDFAYFVRDKRSKKIEQGNARTTLSFDPKKAKEAFELLANYMEDIKRSPEASYISAFKVLGPNYQGERTDSAIMYLTTSDKTIIDKIVKELDARFKKAGIEMYDHAPLGMKNWSPGFSFSHQGPFSSSHGIARSKIINDATDILVKDVDSDLSKEAMKKALQESLKMNGYDIDKPEFLDLINFVENIENTETDTETRRDILKRYILNNKDKGVTRIISANKEMFKKELKQLDKKYKKSKSKEAPYSINDQVLSLDEDFGDDGDEIDVNSTVVEQDITDAMVYGKIMRFRDLFGANKEVEDILESHVRNKCEELDKEDRLFILAMEKASLTVKMNQAADLWPKEESDKAIEALEKQMTTIEKEVKEINDRIVVMRREKEAIDKKIKKVREDITKKRQQPRIPVQHPQDDKIKEANAADNKKDSGDSASDVGDANSSDSDKKSKIHRRRKSNGKK
ncbi:T3SS effector HopA1 family protein [Vallitalea guaymasensis]|uniref:T3SS effector HopA1 family protein n=1 Tax=Vallitalea guaymasensis TaxID=1185412 RepID=UPI000DE1F172|nr:T3SS effector HopA1 family protein [Vallitalea guaymasensis]